MPRMVECILFNARSIVNKWSYLCVELLSFWPNVKIIAITETWVIADNTDLFNLNGFYCFHSHRGNKCGGGTMLLVYESLYPNELIIQSDASLHCDSFNVVACDLLSNTTISRRIRLLVVCAMPNIKIEVLKSLTIVFLNTLMILWHFSFVW